MRKTRSSRTSVSKKSFLDTVNRLYPSILQTVEERDEGEAYPCLIWKGSYAGDIPVFMLNKKTIQVRKVSYCYLYNKEWVRNTKIIPQCVNGKYGCVEPSHMEYKLPIRNPKRDLKYLRLLIREALVCKKNWYYFKDIFDINDKDACMIWKGNVNKFGAPYIVINGKRISLTHWVYTLNHKLNEPTKEISSLVRHTCGNTLCINPRHLKLITKGELK